MALERKNTIELLSALDELTPGADRLSREDRGAWADADVSDIVAVLEGRGLDGLFEMWVETGIWGITKQDRKFVVAAETRAGDVLAEQVFYGTKAGARVIALNLARRSGSDCLAVVRDEHGELL